MVMWGQRPGGGVQPAASPEGSPGFPCPWSQGPHRQYHFPPTSRTASALVKVEVKAILQGAFLMAPLPQPVTHRPALSCTCLGDRAGPPSQHPLWPQPHTPALVLARPAPPPQHQGLAGPELPHARGGARGAGGMWHGQCLEGGRALAWGPGHWSEKLRGHEPLEGQGTGAQKS